MYSSNSSHSHSKRSFKSRKSSNSSLRKPLPSSSSSSGPLRSEAIDEKIGSWSPFTNPRVSPGTHFDAKASVFGSGEGSVFSNLSNILPKEMRKKLDLTNGKEENGNLDGGSVAKLAEESGKLNLNSDLNGLGNVGGSSGGGGGDAESVFVFGSVMKRSVVCNWNEEVFSKLTDEVRTKMSLSSGDGVEEKRKVENVFVFGSERNVTCSFGVGAAKEVPKNVTEAKKGVNLNMGLFSELPDEMRKMNLSNGYGVRQNERAVNVFVFGSKRSETSSFRFGSSNKDSENGNVGGQEKQVFGSGVKKGVDLNMGVFSTLPEEMGKMNLSNGNGVQLNRRVDNVFVFGSIQSETGSFGVDSSKKESENEIEGFKEMVDGSKGFVFGSSGSARSFGGNYIDKLHDDLEKMKIGSKMEDVAGFFPPSASPWFQSSGPTMFTFTGSDTEFKIPNQYATRLTRESLFTGTNSKSIRTKKNKCKSRQSTPFHQSFPNQFVNVEMESQDASGGYSPYHEDFVGDQCSREPSVDEQEEVLVTAAQRLIIDEGNVSQGEQHNVSADSGRLDEKNSEFRRDPDMSENENLNSSASTFTEDKTNASSVNNEKQASEAGPENEGFDSSARTAFTEAETNDYSVIDERQPSDGGPENEGFDSAGTFTEDKTNASSVNNEKQASEAGPENEGFDSSARTAFMEAETNDYSVIDEWQPSDGGPENEGFDSASTFTEDKTNASSVNNEKQASEAGPENEGFDSSARTAFMEAETNDYSVLDEWQPSDGGPENEGFDSRSRTASMEAETSESCVNNERQARTGEPQNVGLGGIARTTPMEAETSKFSVNNGRQDSEGGPTFTLSASSLEDVGQSSFTFSASPFVPDPLSASKNNSKRKGKSKSGHSPSSTIRRGRVPLASPLPDLISHISITGLPDFVGRKSTPSASPSGDENQTGNIRKVVLRKVRQSSFDGVEAQQACEKWRFRGNQAYEKGYLSKADDCYTRGINSVSLKEIPSCCIQPLTLCFSNRAATRMSLGRMREALRDCKMAVSTDPSFLKAHVRIANCYLARGEIGEALKQFNKCLLWEKDLHTNKKYINEASDGLQKAQQVADLTVQASELLLKKSSEDASRAINMISEAILISPYSENLLKMKADALLLMRKYEEVIQLCEKTLDLAEQNSAMTEADPQFTNCSPARLWRWHLISKSYFHLGKLEEALELVRKQEEAKVAVHMYGDRMVESSTLFAVTIRELLRLKSAGKEAFQDSRHLEAVEYYSAALACNAESRPFTAVCFCNRAAAYQAVGQITDAIADCSLAIAVDPSYSKALSRRATLHEMIRDYEHAANDLNWLISLYGKQIEGKVNQSSAVGRATHIDIDLKRARARLTKVKVEARKGIALNMYKILGVEPSSSAADIKKAYRKAALRHHPDKAGQFLVRNENVDDGLWREVASKVPADADRLFKIIGESYTILTDPDKRLQYDEEEEIRTTTPKKGYYGSSTRTSSDTYNGYYYEKNVNRRQWRAQGSPYHR